MFNTEKVLAEIISVIRHLAATHIHWTGTLTQDEALQKLDDLIRLLESPKVEQADEVTTP